MSIFDLFKKKPPQEQVVKEEPKVKAEPKPRKPRVKKSKPEPVTEQTKVEPDIKVNFEYDKTNPRIGNFQLDWNPEFVEFLKSHGYNGNSPEDIVDAWLTDICRNVAGDIPDMYNVRYIQRRDLGGGKTEFS